MIENLGATRDLNDSIDLTDNMISVLGNFPKLLRLKTLLISHNRIQSVHPTTFAPQVPNLEMLVLSNNLLTNLSDLVFLSNLPNLLYLSLVDNPVTLKDYYRIWVIWQNPHIRVLDFQKVKDVERRRAKELFGPSLSEPTELATKILGSAKAKTFSINTLNSSGELKGVSSSNSIKLTEEEKAKLREQLKSATTLAEISRIEQALKSGTL